jgi:uncharacterized protein
MEFDPTHTYTAFSGTRRLASGPLADVAAAAALARDGAAALAAPPPSAHGRPRLGVVAREVTLLPDQWDWLASQPGGASVVLRRLVQEARRTGSTRDRLRRAQERSYKVMVALAGDRPGFEEAARSLFRADLDAFRGHTARWPADIREHLLRLADPDHEPATGNAA